MLKTQRDKIRKRTLRTGRVRGKIFGTADRPRAAVYRSLKHIYIQLINDVKGVTLQQVSDQELSKDEKKLRGLAQAAAVGKLLAKKAVAAKITQVVFDRRRFKYHGRVKALAEGMRQGGLKL